MTSQNLPAVSAGMPLPSEQEPCEHFNVEEYLLQHPKSSFYIQVSGDSMQGKGIFDGDILVVDKTLQPQQDSVVIVQIDGDFTIKSYDSRAGRLRLVPANPAYSALEPPEGCSLCGVATHVIHRL